MPSALSKRVSPTCGGVHDRRGNGSPLRCVRWRTSTQFCHLRSRVNCFRSDPPMQFRNCAQTAEAHAEVSWAVELARSLFNRSTPSTRASQNFGIYRKSKRKFQTSIIAARLGRQRQRFDHGFARTGVIRPEAVTAYCLCVDGIATEGCNRNR